MVHYNLINWAPTCISYQILIKCLNSTLCPKVVISRWSGYSIIAMGSWAGFIREVHYPEWLANVVLVKKPSGKWRMCRLKHCMEVYFDASRHEHQVLKLIILISDQWKKLGWQGRDPSTDFSAAGFISLENLLFFAKNFSLLNKQGGKRSDWEYPFEVAGVNMTFMIMQMLDLESSKPKTFIRTIFIQMLSEYEWAFDLLYCVAFMVMDKQCLDRNASYMEFNEVLRCTRQQLERELLLDDVMRIEDKPSYNLLSQ
ncbi:hypothetical protein J5N97_020601 [Dioscorea zingiberensis]|uniref:ELMO domain-containing protein n=1 Tax=Dioscorea zingiberensis TaxID=325984 RepID=A0A9D5CHC9_9LILI|nr:hypothetical protein J5N97_020601 [Dioscorea zingiberensis]